MPIHYLNADIADGVKQGGGSVSQLVTDIEVICLPKDLPEYFEVDIEELELNEMLFMSDIKIPEGVEIPELAIEVEQTQPIVSIHIIKEVIIEDEEEVVEGEAIEGEEGEAAEGDVAAEAGKGESRD